MKNASSPPKEDNLGTLVLVGSVIFILLIVVFVAIWQRFQFHKTTDILKSLSPPLIREVRVYPRAARVGGSFIIFSPPDKLIDDFVNAVTDIRAYRGSPQGILSRDHEWFVEIKTIGGEIIHMQCHLPANKKKVVHGAFGLFYEKGGGPHYGKFQSENLYRWYQQYSHRWLGEEKEDEEISIEFSP